MEGSEEQQALRFEAGDLNLKPDNTYSDDIVKNLITQLQKLALKEDIDANTDEEETKLQQSIDKELYELTLKETINEAILVNSLNQAIHEEISSEDHITIEGNVKEEDVMVNAPNHSIPGEKGSNQLEVYNVVENNGWGDDDVKQGDEMADSVNQSIREDYNRKESNGIGNYEEKEDKNRRYEHPLRPDAEDCSFYVRTGACKFGSSCKFNHPPGRKYQNPRMAVQQREESSQRPMQTECKYNLTGVCKFGNACRYNHSRGKPAVAPILEFNFLGLPIRPGERECPYYMRNGSCKYGSNCRFNHPDPTTVGGGDPSPTYGNGGSVSIHGTSQTTRPSWSSPRTLKETAPFAPVMYSSTRGVPPPNPEWNGYQGPVYPTSETGLPTPPAFAMNAQATDTIFYTHRPHEMPVEEYPERPGQPECSFFLRTGDCKYKSGCRFHHPKSRIPNPPPFVLSDKGLPLRPDQNICSHYSRYGICKFGPACKYDHPVNYVNSASSGPAPPPSFGNTATSNWA